MSFFPLKDMKNTVTHPKMLRPQLGNLLLVQTLFYSTVAITVC